MKKIKERARLSIDLNAYPDVKEMLTDACEATGLSSTAVTIQSLRKQLRQVVNDVHDGTERFRQKYDNLTNSNDTGNEYLTAEQIAAERASALREVFVPASGALKTKRIRRRSSPQKS